jgi:predicted RecA/RadA family phage recombinase
MRNFIQPGNVITVEVPSGGVVSGQGLLAGSLFGVCATTETDGEVELALTGVFALPATGPISALADCFWDESEGEVVATDGGAGTNKKIGVALLAVGEAATTGTIRLNGISV